jgi:hypothetical protein
MQMNNLFIKTFVRTWQSPFAVGKIFGNVKAALRWLEIQLPFAVCPTAKLEKASLLVEREPFYVDLAADFKDSRWNPRDVAGVIDNHIGGVSGIKVGVHRVIQQNIRLPNLSRWKADVTNVAIFRPIPSQFVIIPRIVQPGINVENLIFLVHVDELLQRDFQVNRYRLRVIGHGPFQIVIISHEILVKPPFVVTSVTDIEGCVRIKPKED